MPMFQGVNQMRLPQQTKPSRKLIKCAVLMICGLGLVGCQRAQFPSNPFAGKLPSPLHNLSSNRLPRPKLPSLANFPRPNFRNLVRPATTPAAVAIAAQTNSSPPPPARSFDTNQAEQQIAAGQMPSSIKSKLEQARLEAEKSRADLGSELSSAQKDFNSAISSTENKSGGDFFAKVNPKQSSAGTQRGTNGLWGDYKPDTRPGSSNVSSDGIGELAKVNHGLYDRYGKLTTPNNKDFAATNKTDFGFKPPQSPSDFATEKVSSDKPDETLDGLRKQLMALRSRGSGTSDQMKFPERSAVELAGVAPPAPNKEPEPSLHRGFGKDNALELGKIQQTVSIPDPTAPTNVLRAAVPAPRGLLSSTPVDTGYRSTSSKSVDSSSLPFGNALSNQLKNASNDDKMVSNDFVASKAPPTLQASTKPKTLELDLPRQLSAASLEALAVAEEARKNQPVPQVIQERGPLAGGISNPNIGSVATESFASPKLANQNFAPPTTPPVSAFQSPFQQPVYSNRTQQVTSNQFFNRAAQPAAAQPAAAQPASVAPAPSPEPVRVAEAPNFGGGLSVGSVQTPFETATQLPAAIKTGDGSYAPGSVRGLDKKQLW